MQRGTAAAGKLHRAVLQSPRASPALQDAMLKTLWQTDFWHFVIKRPRGASELQGFFVIEKPATGTMIAINGH